MIDFHAHILPGIDDGSSSIEESIRMLRLSYRQGVEKIVATPHFYASKESPSHFLKRRNEAWSRLSEALSEGMTDVPQIYLGAEVYYYTGISHTEDLQSLCVENTNVLLLEMPFHKWDDRMINEVISLAQDTDLTILLAHIDRYLSWQSNDTWDTLVENGVLFQVNASAFLDGWRLRRRVCRLLQDGRIEVLGSDCHNMTNRKTNLDEAFAMIQDKFGPACVNELTERAKRLLTK